MAVKFGISQIGKPSPKRFKFFVNACILIGGLFISPAIMTMPDNWIDPQTKNYLLGISGSAVALLKAIEKLLSETQTQNPQ
jgi:hypothetical protein